MPDLNALRPTDNSTASIAAALVRCSIAGRGVLAEIDRIKAARAGLLMNGSTSQLGDNAAEMQAAIAAGTQIQELSEHLQVLLRATAPEQIAEVFAREKAFAAAVQISTWWSAHGAVLLDGLQVMANGLASIAEWQTAAARAATPTPASDVTNVAPFPPRPVA